MAVIGSGNFLGQMRVDVPHLRAIESSICNDFDVLAGNMLAGREAWVLNSFTIPTANTIGSSAENLILNVENGLIIHYFATDSGSIFSVPTNTPAESLNSLNTKVYGSFTANAINYIGVDLIRQVDETSVDLTHFLEADTELEFSEIVPTRRVFNYRIIITNQPFSINKNLVPISIVETDSLNNVLTITDCRPMMFRLGSGGDIPFAKNTYSWGNRTEGPVTYDGTSTDSFSGEDKSIGNLKSWMDSIMTSIWELRGGGAWYSPNNRDNVKLLYGTPTLSSNGDNFNFVGNTLTWSGLRIAFENSPATYNAVQDNIAGVNLLSGQCLYVDIIRETPDGAIVVPVVSSLQTLGTSAIPGRRFIIAWRIGSLVYTRDRPYEIGRALPVATTTTLGLSKLSGTPGSSTFPVVAALDLNSLAIASGLTRAGGVNGSGILAIGTQSSDTAVTVGRTGNNTTIASSNFYAPNIDTPSAVTLTVGGSNQTGLVLGRAGGITTIRGSSVSASAGQVTIDGTSTGVLIGDGLSTYLTINSANVTVSNPLITTSNITIPPTSNYKYSSPKSYNFHFEAKKFDYGSDFTKQLNSGITGPGTIFKNVSGTAITTLKLELPVGSTVNASGISVLISNLDSIPRNLEYWVISQSYNTTPGGSGYATTYLHTGGVSPASISLATAGGAPVWNVLPLAAGGNVTPADGFFQIILRCPITNFSNQIYIWGARVNALVQDVTVTA